MSAMIFIDNKYTRWYFSIVSNAAARSTNLGYSEKHHILPRSLGGNNNKENLVTLTAREHFICHRLLVKMLTGDAQSKMTYALIRLSTNPYSDHLLTARTFSAIRALPRSHTADTKNKISRATSGKNNPRYGKESWSKGQTKETNPIIAKVSAKLVGKPAWNKGVAHTKEARIKMSVAQKGRVLSDEHKRKLSEGKKGNKNPNFGKIPWNKKS